MELDEEEEAARQRYVTSSIDALEKAIQQGFCDWSWIERDSDINPLRKEKRYQDLVRRPLLTNSIGMQLVRIPSGRFMMGGRSTPERIAAAYGEEADSFRNEHPIHEVTISKPFLMGATEVTKGQFRQFVEAEKYITDAERRGSGGGTLNPTKSVQTTLENAQNWQNAFSMSDDHPVTLVSRNDAVAFCEWLSEKEQATYRLPTEAEWEYACCARPTSRYWTGQDPETLLDAANIPDAAYRDSFNNRVGYATIQGNDGFAGIAPVGEFRPNSFGLFDMHGNIWEWCSDRYDPEYYASSPAADPLGPTEHEVAEYFGARVNVVAEAVRRKLKLADGTGVRVVGTEPGSVAEQAGLQPDDVLLAVGDTPIENDKQLNDLIEKSAGSEISVSLFRQGRKLTIPMVPRKLVRYVYRGGCFG